MWAGHFRGAVLLKRCVWIHQAGRTLALACLLITIYLSCWCPFTELHACWFQQSKVITTPPASGVMPNGPSSCQQEHSSLCHFLCRVATISPDQFAPVPSCSISCRASVIFMDVSHSRRTQPCSTQHGSPLEEVTLPGPNYPNPPPKNPVVASSQLCSCSFLWDVSHIFTVLFNPLQSPVGW